MGPKLLPFRESPNVKVWVSFVKGVSGKSTSPYTEVGHFV